MNLGYSVISGNTNGVVFANGEIEGRVYHQHVITDLVNFVPVFGGHGELLKEDFFIPVSLNQLKDSFGNESRGNHAAPP